jgi:hypothetical protein
MIQDHFYVYLSFIYKFIELKNVSEAIRVNKQTSAKCDAEQSM